MDRTAIDFKSKYIDKEFFDSLKNIGFAIIKNPPLDFELIKNTFEDWRLFFASSEKYHYQCDKKSLDGYFPFGLEQTYTNKQPDLKEFFYYYSWGKCPDNLKKKTQTLFEQLVKLGSTLLSYLENNMPVEILEQLSMPLTNMVKDTSRAVLRILHYPPINEMNNQFDKTTADRRLRASEHEDLTLLTIVTQLTGSGLQLRDLQGKWHHFPNEHREDIVINIGEMLSICTRGYFKGTCHRVAMPTSNDASDARYSNAFFLNPYDAVQLDETRTALSCLQNHINKKLGGFVLNEKD